MAARPRSHKITIPNLYRKLDKRNGKVYWQYKHPLTGTFHSLGTDAEEAALVASQANTVIAEQQTKQILSVNERLSTIKNKKVGISVANWIDRYLEIQQERVELGELKLNSYKQKIKPLNLFKQHCGTLPLKDITALEIARIIDEVKALGHNRMAQVVRFVLIDVFKEAQHMGYVPPGYNPAQATKKPRNKVKRERLSFEEWEEIYKQSANHQHYLRCGMLLAVITGQRLGDITKMKFSDIWDGMLHVQQEKTGAKLAIPLSLKCDALNLTLGDVISICRDLVVSPYLLHYKHTSGNAKIGGRVSNASLTTSFKNARNKCGLEWEEGTAPSFHELRSLSERLYREQGIDTQKLLGHRTQIMTDKYNDDRGKEWQIVVI
ncbi:tyrosine-type recombinase/integrase [Providencia rettgeri]|uniref:phage integrase Arm DNA-binding domain-containing protein n=1 Tax=Providencia rettgeri TaxID=587 RepID=UPI001419D48C|nr:phage integrase Arm DNA-binding domain-containing protein [Providencia rettgeri]NIA73994.1 tyrosine-type recombinase/integrase [Providencia rettgeri]NIA79806.1 tyrosine-type recombinase/integrase [Providencia rettgeri]NIB03026.1 tyrosine-type recombinase/integrase [Providencia rettgeri]NIB07193.1 tyrosine-type recombinase/integrase [Providencia rettgeri]NIB20718.1 tyrosine-type recombinase/integrase [Providencia rettgeri]